MIPSIFNFIVKRKNKIKKCPKYNQTINRGYHGMEIAIIKNLFTSPPMSCLAFLKHLFAQNNPDMKESQH